VIQRVCKHHGLVDFVFRGSEARYRCKKCAVVSVTERRRKVIKEIKEAFGAKCSICGYSKCAAALDFHHINPEEKEREISVHGCTFSKAKLLEEAKKCILICSNCHREVHDSQRRVSALVTGR
jgi:predicted HNH restriction endonuclease